MKLIQVFCLILLFSCNNPVDQQPDPDPNEEEMEEETEVVGAKVLSLSISGNPGQYTFNVEVESPDTGCDQYADWWEVFTPDEVLIFRRILAHSHVNEQPFKRSGGPIDATAEQELIIRAHMNNLGYGTQVMRGTVADGFVIDTIGMDIASELATESPLPGDCAF